MTGIHGTFNFLETGLRNWNLNNPKKIGQKRFLHLSTDEDFGSIAQTGLFTEISPYLPSIPYFISKATQIIWLKTIHGSMTCLQSSSIAPINAAHINFLKG